MRLLRERCELHISSVVDSSESSEVSDLVDLRERGQVSAEQGARSDSPHIVRSREDGDAQSFMLDRVSTLSDLMRANDGRNLVLLCPPASHVGSKSDSDALPQRRGQPTIGRDCEGLQTLLLGPRP